MAYKISGSSLYPGADGWSFFEQPAAIDQLAGIGATYANFVQVLYQDDWSSSDVYSGARSQLDDEMQGAIEYASDLGMQTSIYILLETTQVDAALRHSIDVDDPQRWFEDYGDYIVNLATIGEQSGLDMLIIGGELHKMADDPDYRAYWLDIIADVRAVFSGTVSYSGVWQPASDGVGAISFADALDSIGISFYNPTSDKEDATVEDMVDAWHGDNQYEADYVEAITQIHEDTGKPIFFSEIGGWAYDGATGMPATNMLPPGFDWRVPGALGQLDANLEEHANYYEAAYEVWSDTDWMEGFLWWSWYELPGEGWSEAALRDREIDFTPNGKPAADVMESWQLEEIVGQETYNSISYDGARGEYNIRIFDDAIYDNAFVLVRAIGGEIDKLIGFDRIDLLDGDYVYDIDSANTGFGYRIYQASFGRTPDESGVRFWIDVLDSLDDQAWSQYDEEQFLASQFIESVEFKDLFGANPTNEQYIDAMYLNVLDRLPDQGGYDFWVGGMEQGLTREDILIAFTKSDENVARTAADLDDGVWVV